MAAMFIFRHDLRVDDNTALEAAREACRAVLPVFVLPDAQIDPARNAYFSHAAVQFMCESLQSLHQATSGALRTVRCADDALALEALLRCNPSVRAVYFNADAASVHARQRDARLTEVCARRGVKCVAVPGDYDILRPHEGLVPDGGSSHQGQQTRTYSNLSQFFRRMLQEPGFAASLASHQAKDKTKDQAKASLKAADTSDPALRELQPSELSALYEPLRAPAQRGGREEGLKALERMRAMAGSYGETRDTPALNLVPGARRSTTLSSAHLRFGTISVREALAAVAGGATEAAELAQNALLRELAFREFYRKIFEAQPELQRGRAFRHELDRRIAWKRAQDAPAEWEAWTAGRTGVPLVDAGMRELLATGFVHNRVRMVVASFATRHLGFDWRECARFYYTKLVDADPVSNTAGWQWAAGVGVDSAPYFRRPLNPLRQALRFDRDCAYIKHWLPELAARSARDIHRLSPSPKAVGSQSSRSSRPSRSSQSSKPATDDYDYPAPIVDLRATSDAALSAFRLASGKRAE